MGDEFNQSLFVSTDGGNWNHLGSVSGISLSEDTSEQDSLHYNADKWRSLFDSETYTMSMSLESVDMDAISKVFDDAKKDTHTFSVIFEGSVTSKTRHDYIWQYKMERKGCKRNKRGLKYHSRHDVKTFIPKAMVQERPVLSNRAEAMYDYEIVPVPMTEAEEFRHFFAPVEADFDYEEDPKAKRLLNLYSSPTIGVTTTYLSRQR